MLRSASLSPALPVWRHATVTVCRRRGLAGVVLSTPIVQRLVDQIKQDIKGTLEKPLNVVRVGSGSLEVLPWHGLRWQLRGCRFPIRLPLPPPSLFFDRIHSREDPSVYSSVTPFPPSHCQGYVLVAHHNWRHKSFPSKSPLAGPAN